MTNTTTDAAEARALLTRTMLIYCVIGDTHGETAGDQWLVGTFPTAEEASAAAAAEREAKPGCDATIYLGSIVVEPSQPVFLATAEAASGAGEREGRFWLIVRAPGKVPERKGPWPHREAAHRLREFIAARPRAFIDVLTIDHDGTPEVEHGPEVLQYTDGRSMSVGRKHNQRVRDAAEEALASLPPATDPAIPDGWKLVPIEPTDEMLEAAAKAASRNDMPSRVDDVVPYEECDSLFRAEWRAEVEAAYLAALAAAPTIPATGEAVPEGMKPWHGGDAAPNDLDLSGRVLREDGQTEAGRDVTIQQWKRPVSRCKWNIIAYTPKATIPATGHAATEGEGA